MASTRPATDEPGPPAPPSKRTRLSPESGESGSANAMNVRVFTADVEVGISEYLNPETPGFSGIIKQRYTDFLVNEIDPQGNVLRLKDVTVPKSIQSKRSAPEENIRKQSNGSAPEKSIENPAAQSKHIVSEEISEEKVAPLKEYLPDEILKSIIRLYTEILQHHGTPGSKLPSGRVETDVIDSKDHRSKIHQLIRTIFDGKLSTQTSSDLKIGIWATRGKSSELRGQDRQGSSSSRKSWEELGGSYLGFNLYKENKETQQCIGLLARMLRVPPKALTFAGTKDRRAVTVQRVCAHKVRAEDLEDLNPKLKGLQVGDFEYRKGPIQLAELSGNEFCISIRDCDFGDSGIDGFESAMRSLRDRGFINYYGLQRFGTFSTGTHSVGVSMLKADWEEAVAKIMAYDKNLPENYSPDEANRAEACKIWAEGKPDRNAAAKQALKAMPKKFASESAVLRFFSRGDSRSNWLGSLQQIPRNLRLIFVHAYQSYVWNTVASERIRKFGTKVLAGDLVILSAGDTTNRRPTIVHDDDEGLDDEVMDDYNESDLQEARPITQEEVDQNKFTLYDVVIPTPGWAVKYPENNIKQVYVDVMAKDGLDPFDMKRNQRETNLSGNYRKLVYKPEKLEWEVKTYTDPQQQLVDTDLAYLAKKEKERTEEANTMSGTNPTRTAAVIKIRLGTSQYATMALREASKGKVWQFDSASEAKKSEANGTDVSMTDN